MNNKWNLLKKHDIIYIYNNIINLRSFDPYNLKLQCSSKNVSFKLDVLLLEKIKENKQNS